jgi:hypothetical protein
MTIQNILAGFGAASQWSILIDPVYDEEGNELPVVSPVVNGVFDPRPYEIRDDRGEFVRYKGIALANTGKPSFKSTFNTLEANPYFIGWLVTTPTNNNLLVII